MEKALVVENNPVLLKAVSTILEQEGFEVRTADNGLHALEIMEGFTPNLVFTDLVMPLVGGEQLCRIIRSTPSLAQVFLVILSAIILEEKEQILQEIDCDLCIAKGNLREMREHIRQALNVYQDRKKNRTGKTGPPEKRIPAGLKPSPVTLELLSEKRHISELINHLSEGILELSGQGKIVSVNQAAVSIFGIRREEMIGSPFVNLSWGKHKPDIASWLDRQLVAGGLERLEIEEDDPLQINGKILIATFIPIQEDATSFAVCIFRDITRQYLAEEHKRELDRAVRLMTQMDAMSCMAGGFAHDFNNLLTVICGNLDMLLHAEDHKKAVDGRKVLDHAQRAASVAVDLVQKISCFSNFGIISREDVQIGDVVSGAVNEFFEKHGGSFDLTLTGGDSFVHVDSAQIRTALLNVLHNAGEASANREIRIEVRDEEFKTPTIILGQYIPAGRYSRIDVRDQGKGITRENILKIFDPYYSTKQRGTVKGMGLGLTIVYATLRNHGGCVVVDSELDKGTMVSLFLPVFNATIPSKRQRENVRHTTCRVMLVEEDDQLREIGRIMLEYLGYAAIVAADAQKAVRILREGIGGTGQRVAVVILDLSGSDDAEHAAICRALHEADPEVKIVAASASILDPIMEDCRKFGCVNTLPKPYTMDSLNHVLAALQC
jgi:PAS domain S-box-containing protein